MPADDFAVIGAGLEFTAFTLRYPGAWLALSGAPFPDQGPVATSRMLVTTAYALAVSAGTSPRLLNDHA
jgi:hypothetical protein